LTPILRFTGTDCGWATEADWPPEPQRRNEIYRRLYG